MSVPVVFIHSGNNAYLINTFYQLKQSNPGVEVYLIGTAESNIYASMVNHEDIREYIQEAEAFKNIYQHFSTNSEAFELICIQRWFILKEFLKKKDIDRCLYLDSDVLIYSSIPDLALRYESFGMTICGISGHTNFIYRKTLEDFCKFVVNTYSDHKRIQKLRQHYESFIGKHGKGGVSDMTLLTQFAEENKGVAADLYTPWESECFDPSFQVGEEYFLMEGNGKKINMQQRKPYATNIKNNRMVLFHTLHFQGSDAKKQMHRYIPVFSWKFRWLRLKYALILSAQKIRAKLSR